MPRVSLSYGSRLSQCRLSRSSRVKWDRLTPLSTVRSRSSTGSYISRPKSTCSTHDLTTSPPICALGSGRHPHRATVQDSSDEDCILELHMTRTARFSLSAGVFAVILGTTAGFAARLPAIPAAPQHTSLEPESGARQVNEDGFGDRYNSIAWSMLWWRGQLYVGTYRASSCVRAVQWSQPYPPPDPDLACTPNPLDLPLQAEIWRYTPEIELWQRVYQAPLVPIP